ncbi:hypothetical protein PGAL8A_00001100 [Plasmodium gallinaceum]|uniref:Uncharacterized protein n=1 Tax=Plasmodium gallinaceum TaxID=5849 RepID=A0A1J1GSG2_PLAGA|nr:hypothetical protein PGAL8A_00001100 [Plasmodium gallinaceum]CRG95246.1 hypothetical protein PGAL8A_00001100 [Plasmodium gallinaceum]
MRKNICWIFFVIFPFILFGTVLSNQEDVPTLPKEPINGNGELTEASEGRFHLRSTPDNEVLVARVKGYKSALIVQGRKLNNIKKSLDEIQTYVTNKLASIYWERTSPTQLTREEYMKEFEKFNEFYNEKMHTFDNLRNNNVVEHSKFIKYHKDLSRRINNLKVLSTEVLTEYNEVMKISKQNIELIYLNQSLCNIIQDYLNYLGKKRVDTLNATVEPLQPLSTDSSYETNSTENPPEVVEEVNISNGSNGLTKVMVIIGVLGGLCVCIGAGYFIYTKKLMNTS